MVSRVDRLAQPSMRLALSDETRRRFPRSKSRPRYDRIEYRCIATDGASPHLKDELAAEMTPLTDAMSLGGLR